VRPTKVRITEMDVIEKVSAPLRVSGPIKGYFIATEVQPAAGQPGSFTSRVCVCTTRPQSWPLRPLIHSASGEVWCSENEAHLQGFRRAKRLLDDVRA
jgi:hypothetical protein